MTIPISSQWPVVVSLPRERSSRRPATAGAPGCGGQPISGSMFPSPSASSVGRSSPPTALRDVAERVRALVAEVGGVGQLSRPDGIEHDHARAGHAAILRRVANVLGLIGFVVFIACVIASRRA